MCQIPVWWEEGSGIRGSPEITPRAPTQKRYCGTEWPIQEDITSSPIRSRILHELLISQSWQSRFKVSCCSTVTTTVSDPQTKLFMEDAAKLLRANFNRCQKQSQWIEINQGSWKFPTVTCNLLSEPAFFQVKLEAKSPSSTLKHLNSVLHWYMLHSTRKTFKRKEL